MKRSGLRPTKKHDLCNGTGCSICDQRGWMPKAKKPAQPMARKAISKKPKTKRHAANLQYSALRAAFMAANPRCVVLQPSGAPCGQPATECHHRKSRGRFYLAVETFLSCCHPCHEKLHGTLGEWAFRMHYRINPASIRPLPPVSTIFLPYDPTDATPS